MELNWLIFLQWTGKRIEIDNFCSAESDYVRLIRLLLVRLITWKANNESEAFV